MYKIGPLFPKTSKGEPNIVLSSSYELNQSDDGSFAVHPVELEDELGQLKTSLTITTDPVNIPGIDEFMDEWLIPQMTIMQRPEQPNYYVQNSLYAEERKAVSTPKNELIGKRFDSLYKATRAGYVGIGSKDYTLNNSYWNDEEKDDSRDAKIISALRDDDNWKPIEYWGSYKGGTLIKSKYDAESLKTALPGYAGPLKERKWIPSLLYTYKRPGHRTTMPGPVLMINPGDQVKIKFTNDIKIPGLSSDELIQTSLVKNDSQGSGGSAGMGGTTSTNFHGHGLHVNSVGFGDNVVSRYTTNQQWTTEFDVDSYHNMGSYWYHPHYHPSVNSQVYGGLSGPLQMGDPLSRVPDFADVPRNMAIIKQNGFSVDQKDGSLRLENYTSSPWANQKVASTVNGEFSPTVESEGGWQSLSIGNQANQALYNISLHHTDPSGKRSVLPVFIYGEDGHQYPQLRRAKGVLAQLVDKSRRNKAFSDVAGYNACESDEGPGIPLPIKYPHKQKRQNIQFEDFVSLPPGKRVDLLFYLPEGKTEITSLYTIHTDHPKWNLYSVNNMGLYPNLTSSNREWRLGNNGCKIPYSVLHPTSKTERQSLISQQRSAKAYQNHSAEISSETRIEAGSGTGDGSGSGGGSNPTPSQGAGHGQGTGGYQNDLRRPGPGPLATFNVKSGDSLPPIKKLEAKIEKANANISIQKVKPTTKKDNYDVEKKIPSINLFRDQWIPVRQREFNWANRVLVGPKNEWDEYTKNQYQLSKEAGSPIERYVTNLKSWTNPKTNESGWGGYDSPFLINDHVFPNGPLTIAQLGTMEEWTLWNWSVLNGQKYTGHPFHIHVNDYQVKNSDTELSNKRNLEDTTMLNSTGWNFVDMSSADQSFISSKPFRGDLKTIGLASDKGRLEKMSSQPHTWGANSMQVRMLFQDYIGTYVYHCHILPHEDRGMMQVVTVVENTDSSWLLPVEGLDNEANYDKENQLTIYRAQGYEPRSIELGDRGFDLLERSSVGDMNDDDIQDVALSSSAKINSGSGSIVIVDGEDLLKRKKTTAITTLTPYPSDIAPWVFIEDFSGDGRRDLVTAGFSSPQSGSINLKDLRIDMFLPQDRKSKKTEWKQKFQLFPFREIRLEGAYQIPGMDHATTNSADHQQHSLKPVDGLIPEQVSVVMADINLDNFNDYIVAYAIDNGLRIVALDGAAVALHYQTGKKEGGYFADKEILAESVLVDPKISRIDRVVMTSGFNDYNQSPLENLLVNIQSGKEFSQYSLQLNVGHFIATSELDDSTESMSRSHGGHGSTKMEADERLVNIGHGKAPMRISDYRVLPYGHIAPTPVIAGARGNGAQVLNSHLAFAQGNNGADGQRVNGNRNTSRFIHNTAQQSLVSLIGLGDVDKEDLEGIVDSTVESTFELDQVDQKNNVAALTHIAYTGEFVAPGDMAKLASGVLGKNRPISSIVDELTTRRNYIDFSEEFYGASFEDLSVRSIVDTSTRALAGRKPSASELSKWSDAVTQGMEKHELPLNVLMNLTDIDYNRVAMLSEASKWLVSQWATSANVNGSFSQGLVGNEDKFAGYGSSLIQADTPFDDMASAQEFFDAFKTEALEQLVGTPVSKHGMF